MTNGILPNTLKCYHVYGKGVIDMVEDNSNVVTEEQAEQSLRRFDNFVKSGTIVCSVWLIGSNGARDKFIGSVKRKVGKKDFVIKGKRYWINYDFLKEGKKLYYYDCDVNNSVGALSFHDVSKEKVSPNQADMMLVDGVVRVLMGKGGIPAMYLLVAMIITGIAVAGMMYFLSQYQTLSGTVETQKVTISSLKAENNNLKSELEAIIINSGG